MTTEQQLETAELLLPYLSEYNGTQQIRNFIHGEDMKKLCTEIFGLHNLSLGCVSCVIHQLNMIASWYEKAKADWVKNQIIQMDEEPLAPVTAPEPAPVKRARKKKA